MKTLKNHLFIYSAYFALTFGFVLSQSTHAVCQSKASISPVETLVSSDKETVEKTWLVDAVHSKVKFSVTHLVISEVEGKFDVYNGNIRSNSEDFSGAAISFSIDAASINTDNEMRDNHLKSADFFDTENHPQLTFKSTSFKKKKGNKYELNGDMTIRGTTKPVTFEVTYGGQSPDGYGNTKAGFKATTTIDRYDYGLKWNAMTEAGGLTVGQEVEIVLNLQFALQANP